MYTGLDVEVEIENDGKLVRVIPPKGASLNQVFILGKYDAIAKAFKLLDIDTIEIVERFVKKEEMEPIEAVKESEKSEESEGESGEEKEEKSEGEKESEEKTG